MWNNNSQNNNSADRRIFARIPKILPVRFLASGWDKESQGQTVDISATGIGLLSEEKFSPQTSLEIWLELPDKQNPFYTRGKVVWSRFLADKAKQHSGIRLEKAELMGLAPILWK